MIPTLLLQGFLSDEGYSGSLPEAFSKYLADQGYTGPLNEATYLFLGDLGYEGTLPERMYSWILDGLAVGTPTDYDTAALAYYEAGDPIIGTDATVTGINLRGTGGMTLATTAGTAVGNSPDGLVFSNGAFLRITGISPDTADGMVVVVDVTFDDLAGSGVPYNFGNVATVLKANGGPVLMRANSNGFSQSVYTTTVGERIVAAIELDAVADNVRYWNLNTEAIVSTAYTLPSLAPTYLNIGQGMTGTVHRLAVIPRPSGGALSVTLEQALADFLAGV